MHMTALLPLLAAFTCSVQAQELVVERDDWPDAWFYSCQSQLESSELHYSLTQSRSQPTIAPVTKMLVK